jgi:hypothetical protein
LVSLDKNRVGTKFPNISKRLSRERMACTFFRVNLLARPKRSGPKPDRKGARWAITEMYHNRNRLTRFFIPNPPYLSAIRVRVQKRQSAANSGEYEKTRGFRTPTETVKNSTRTPFFVHGPLTGRASRCLPKIS